MKITLKKFIEKRNSGFEKSIKESSRSLEKSLRELTLVTINGALRRGNNMKRENLSYSEDEGQEAIILCNQFKEKYGKELNYRFEKGLCYFSYQ